MSSKTILWNGPVGVFELESFSKGTKEIVQPSQKHEKWRFFIGRRGRLGCSSQEV